MLIGSKLPPKTVDKTYFNLGRAAFAFLIGEIIKPSKVYLPSFTCWSLVSTMQKRFPNVDLVFYNVTRELKCDYPKEVKKGEVLVFIHFFGHENNQKLPDKKGGYILEDISHALTSKIIFRGDYIFGSLRKAIKVADGGIILNKFFNPIYEKSNNLDSWLRYEAKNWKDIREAENMIDREWFISDISSQSLEIINSSNFDLIRRARYENEKFLYENIKVGKSQINFKDNEAPLIHNRIISSKKKRNEIREYLASKGIFTSIHWPAHELIKNKKDIFKDAIWLEDHTISIPVSQDYNLNDMEYITYHFNKFLK